MSKNMTFEKATYTNISNCINNAKADDRNIKCGYISVPDFRELLGELKYQDLVMALPKKDSYNEKWFAMKLHGIDIIAKTDMDEREIVFTYGHDFDFDYFGWIAINAEVKP